MQQNGGTTDSLTATLLISCPDRPGLVAAITRFIAENNGNIVQQQITVPSSVGVSNGFTAVQKYYYDTLNRIDDATETVGGTQTWRQDYTFDRYGNRNFVEANTTTIPRNCGGAICALDHKIYNPAVNTSNNRLSSSDTYGFDSGGNTTGDPQGRTFKYDSENKQGEVRNSSNQLIGQYFYDGDGKRVKKKGYDSSGNLTEETIFVYDAMGRSIAEYTPIDTAQGDSLAAPTVSYLTADHLGSPRINTDASGAVLARHDYHPYGEEITTTQRTAHPDYSGDSVRKKFTGYERDGETDLDFAQARYYPARVGRFSSPDPISTPGNRRLDPQAINLYVYSRNGSLIFRDPTGKYFEGTDGKPVQVSTKDGKISVGKNASPDLQRMAKLISDKGSKTAAADFMKTAQNDTKVHFNIQTNKTDRPGLLGLHQAHDKDGKALEWQSGSGGTGKFDGNPAFITDKNGNTGYAEATITIFEGNINSSIAAIQQNRNDPGLSTEDYMVATFAHESDHDTNSDAVSAIKDRQEGRENNFDVETPAYAETNQVLDEIRTEEPLGGCIYY